jgi:hypothetical protein
VLVLPITPQMAPILSSCNSGGTFWDVGLLSGDRQPSDPWDVVAAACLDMARTTNERPSERTILKVRAAVILMFFAVAMFMVPL